MKSLESFTCIKMSNSCESYLTFRMTTRIGVLVTLRHLALLKMSLIKLQLLSATAISLSGQNLKRWILQWNVGHQEKRENRVKRENWTKKQRRNGYLVPWPGNFYERTRNWNKASSTNWTQCHWWRQARGRKEKKMIQHSVHSRTQHLWTLRDICFVYIFNRRHSVGGTECGSFLHRNLAGILFLWRKRRKTDRWTMSKQLNKL